MKKQWLDFLCAVDRSTQRIVWRWPGWKGYPKMIPADINIVIKNIICEIDVPITEENFQKFQVRLDSFRKILIDQTELDDTNLAKLQLQKYKCRQISAWLNKLYMKSSEYEGILPGIYLASPGSYEEQLHKDTAKKVATISQELIYEFHDKMWLAQSAEEFNDILQTARSRWLI